MPDLTAVAANLHNERKAVRWLARRGRADAPGHYSVAFVSEAHRRRRSLNGVPGQRYLTGPSRGPAQETGILLADGLPLRGRGSAFLSAALPRFSRVGKERWGQVATTRIGRTDIDLITVHPVAGPKALAGQDATHPLVKAYADAMVWLDAMLTISRLLDREAVVGMDCQMPAGNTRPWSAHRVLESHDLSWHWVGIDVLAWTPGLAASGRGKHDIGSDHPALSVDLTIRKNRRRHR